MLIKPTSINHLRILRLLGVTGCLVFLTLPALAQQASDQSGPERLIAGPRVTATTAPPPTAKPTPIVDKRPVNPEDGDNQKEKRKKNKPTRNEFVNCHSICKEVIVNCKAEGASVEREAGREFNPNVCKLNLTDIQGKVLSAHFGRDICGVKEKTKGDELPTPEPRNIRITAAEYIERLNPENTKRVVDVIYDVVNEFERENGQDGVLALLSLIYDIQILYDELYHIQDEKDCTRPLQCAEYRSANWNLKAFKGFRLVVQKLLREYPNYSEAIMKDYCLRETLLSYAVQIEKCACKATPFGYGPCRNCALTAKPMVSRFCRETKVSRAEILRVRDGYLEVPANQSHTCAAYATQDLCERKNCGERKTKGFNRCMKTLEARRDIFKCIRTADRIPPFVDMRR